ncbi:hypothetical protein ONE63_006303 [Megalurothrips usitatus]|uniref:F-box domain-containing protein n=1 Tax=Megalurothrips usitatus TaxID=439358 RepID=A0AAV7XZV8_9NEOP|nr:hypothetical protein ONE63_006303 [Megalurothrips usitatus]
MSLQQAVAGSAMRRFTPTRMARYRSPRFELVEPPKLSTRSTRHQEQAAELAEPYMEPQLPFIENKCSQLDSFLLTLPPEVLTEIIKYLDGKSLFSLSSTCSLLFNLVNEVAQWDRFVLHDDCAFPHFLDLGIHFLTPLWGLSYSCVTNREACALRYPWKQIYSCVHTWSSVYKWEFSLCFTTDVPSDEITTVDIAGQDVIFGTRKGGVGVWNPDKSEKNITFIIRKHLVVDQVIVQLSHESKKEDLHYRVIIHWADTLICIYDMTGYIIKGDLSPAQDLRKISSCGDTLFEWDPVRGTAANTLMKKSDMERCSDFRNYEVPFGPFVAVNSNEGLFISQKRGPLLVEYESLHSHRKLTQKPLLSNVNDLCIYKAYIWPGGISLSFTAGRVIVSVGEKCRIIPWPNSFKCTSAALVGRLFMVGTNQGRILLYFLKTPEDLLNLDPHSYLKKLNIGCPECVIYVGVRVQNKVHQMPDVVAATESKLLCFRATGFVQ